MIEAEYSYEEEFKLEQHIEQLIGQELSDFSTSRNVILESKLDIEKLEKNMIQIFKNTYFNTKKLKPIILYEAFSEDDDDYSVAVLTLLTQLEFDLKSRFYLSLQQFVDNVLFSLKTKNNKYYSIVNDCLINNRPFTMGVLKMWLYGIEEASKKESDLKNCMKALLGNNTNALQANVFSNLLSKYRNIRNNIAHESKIILIGEYTNFCNMLIGEIRFTNWIKNVQYKGDLGSYLGLVSGSERMYRGKEIWKIN